MAKFIINTHLTILNHFRKYMITTSAMISELYTKKIIGKKRPKKINVNKSVQKAVKKYRFKK